MLDPKFEVGERWKKVEEEFIPEGSPPEMIQALRYAFYRGMQGTMSILHKNYNQEPQPTEPELIDFMNGLETAMSDFYDEIYPKEVSH